MEKKMQLDRHVKAMVFVATLLLHATSGAMTKEEQTKIIKDDQATWAKSTMIVDHFVQPPANWQRIDDPDLNVTLYFPCEAVKKVDDAVSYSCAFGQHSYSAVMSRGDFGWPSSNQIRMAGQTYQVRKRFQDTYGEPVVTTPIARISYAKAALGRQEKTVSPKLDVIMRTLFFPTLTMTLTVGAKSGELPDDAKTFFNSVQVIK
jgi:hypothetical protein